MARNEWLSQQQLFAVNGSPTYSIDGLCPSGGIGGYGFNIHLAPTFRDAVAWSRITPTQANRVIETYGSEWLQKCGFSGYFDPENCGMYSDARAIPSVETKPSFAGVLRVDWGEWGPEHITVPGNACGLDISDSGFCVFTGGRTLLPHNVDHWGQVQLLLIVFCWFAHSITLRHEEDDDGDDSF